MSSMCCGKACWSVGSHCGVVTVCRPREVMSSFLCGFSVVQIFAVHLYAIFELINNISLTVQGMGICGMIFRTSTKTKTTTVLETWVSVARRIVAWREMREVVNGGEVRKRKMGMKDTMRTMKTRRRKEVQCSLGHGLTEVLVCVVVEATYSQIITSLLTFLMCLPVLMSLAGNQCSY